MEDKEEEVRKEEPAFDETKMEEPAAGVAEGGGGGRASLPEGRAPPTARLPRG